MSLTPLLLLCTENITANMRVVKTGGGEFDMEDVHNGLLCRVGEKPSIRVSVTCVNMPVDPYIIYVHIRQ